MDEFEAKKENFAKMIDGRVVHDEQRVQVCIKGTVLGFPATLEAIGASWPFGVNYFIETKVIDDPMHPNVDGALKLTILPRVARGFMQIAARILLIEPKGQKVGDARIEKHFILSYNNADDARRFCQYPGVYEKLMDLHNFSKFSELLVKADGGLWMAQPTNFRSLSPEEFKQTFKVLGDIGQIMFDMF